MSDIDTGGAGYDGGGQDVDYGHYAAGQEHDALNQLHEAHGSEADYNNQQAVYENDHHADTSTDYSHGTHVEFDQAPAVHYEADEFTNYSHDASVDDHVFAAEGSEHAHQAQFGELDALQSRFDAAFAEGTEFHGGEGHLGTAAG
ncbi:hypothetical protein AB0M46_40355 [Dactylosporangium sp. NPDC051485]|uniref:hypothetical protein n=1 Tax=Dactylosporangium sp. NPDC051485 TaxID=3154846 RepID=UPI00341AB43D